MRVAAIVPSAGSGRRMRSKLDKPLIKIAGLTLISYVLRALQNSSLISEIIIAARAKDIPGLKRLAGKNQISKIKGIVRGGRSRAESVFRALSRVSPGVDFVLVHDVARPFITQELIRTTIEAAKRYSAAVACIPVKSTIKEAGLKNLMVKNTLDRRRLWEAQTPQAFRKDLLFGAYGKAGRKARGFTDDASLVEWTGKKVKIVRGSYSNIKITTPEDLVIAEAIAKRIKD